MQRGQCYRVTDQTGADLGAYVLKPMGAELWISAAAGRADVDLTAVMFALIEGQAREFDSVAFQTKRRGLKYKAMRHGYGVAQVKPDGSYIMRKAMK